MVGLGFIWGWFSVYLGLVWGLSRAGPWFALRHLDWIDKIDKIR